MTSDAPETELPHCPKCSGDMWDNRESKRNPRAPDFKCKNRECDGVIWPPRDAQAAAAPQQPSGDEPACPVCGGRMWDDRASKRNPRAPDFKCRNKPKFQGGPGCPGVIWPPREGERKPSAGGAPRASAPRADSSRGDASRVHERPAARAPYPQSRTTSEPPPEVIAQRDFSDDELDDDLPF